MVDLPNTGRVWYESIKACAAVQLLSMFINIFAPAYIFINTVSYSKADVGMILSYFLVNSTNLKKHSYQKNVNIM